MPPSAKILLDSVSPAGRRLTTWELTYPRFVHAELMTHRLFSRNSASSRAIPNEKLRARVKDDPAMPVWWGKNQPGMQAREELTALTDSWCEGSISPRQQAKNEWLRARDIMLEASERLSRIGLHKQLCNRLIEPWMHITVIVSATTFDNWFRLRDHSAAQPEIAWVAKEMHHLYEDHQPRRLEVGQWHLPLVAHADSGNIEDEDAARASVLAAEINNSANPPNPYWREKEVLKAVSVGRCARVSYLTHAGRRDLREDVALHDKLLAGMKDGSPLHMSPFEHVAQCLADPNEQSGNFRGWKQYRKEFAGEHHGERMS